ncbi:hypothetical protein L6164_031678 [Bauhinia variegata]|uniref:Uncharacterized protein n=1 Tax=Bauhinia variegata TaxID=167791 RepID=A0ACB9LFP9_BAUVA|nr:hypothetical protein L6164_031678 [Bauhinia variegata]
MILYPYCSLLMVAFLLLINRGSSHNHCKELRCGDNGPPIRFPFYLIDDKADYSGYPSGFGLSCTDKSQTLLELSDVKLLVEQIDYQDQIIYTSNPKDCLPNQLLKIINSSNLPSKVGVDPTDFSSTFFNCSSVEYKNLRTNYWTTDEQDLFSCPIVVVHSYYDIVDLDLLSCTKLFDVTTDLFGFNYEYNNILRWSKPNCRTCESKNMMCKMINNETNGETECFTCDATKGVTSSIIIASGVTGPILSVLLIVALFYIYNYFKTKGEDQARVENFLEDYRTNATIPATDVKLKMELEVIHELE